MFCLRQKHIKNFEVSIEKCGGLIQVTLDPESILETLGTRNE